MVNKYYQKKQRKASKTWMWYQNLSEEEKEKAKKRLETDKKIFPKKKEKNSINISSWNKNLSAEESESWVYEELLFST